MKWWFNYVAGKLPGNGKKGLPVPVLAEAAADNRESSRRETPAHSGEARESTKLVGPSDIREVVSDSRGGQSPSHRIVECDFMAMLRDPEMEQRAERSARMQ